MRTTIDVGGKVMIPKSIRDELNLQAGSPLEVGVRDGMVVLERANVRKRLVRERGFLVVEPEEPIPPLTDEMVRQTLEDIRFRR